MSEENSLPNQCGSRCNTNEEDKRKENERASARWSILRNALLHKATTTSVEHSIHRFPGYNMLQRQAAELDAVVIVSELRNLRWDSRHSTETNQERLRISCLAVAATFPKGKCIDIIDCPLDNAWLDGLKQLCKPSVSLLLVEDKSPSSITLLVQEVSSASKYTIYKYVLDEQCAIWTREPRESRLSLDDLVSHRRTGVDNTGNVCVWDSERSLAFMLFHHLADFAFFKESPPRRILELGTGMAGLAAVALGLRLIQIQGDDASGKVQILLTDGHPDGVTNNRVNQLLTKVSVKHESQNPYHFLDISEQMLLWTTDLKSSISSPQDLILVSDCTHFQSFHAALAITTLRCLRVDGTAIFCQPTRGDSLENFCRLLGASTGLVALEWWTHPILEDHDKQARRLYPDLYDSNLHCPKILLIRKLRDITEQDCQIMIQHQEARGSIMQF